MRHSQQVGRALAVAAWPELPGPSNACLVPMFVADGKAA
jgi:hypothetical protein